MKKTNEKAQGWGVYMTSGQEAAVIKPNPGSAAADCIQREKRKKRVYLAGAITGNPCYKKQFGAMEKKLERAGYIVLNPAELPQDCGWTYKDYIDASHALLKIANCVYFLDGFESSKGAIFELAYCAAVGIEVINERQLNRTLLFCGWSNLIGNLRKQEAASETEPKGK